MVSHSSGSKPNWSNDKIEVEMARFGPYAVVCQHMCIEENFSKRLRESNLFMLASKFLCELVDH